MSKKEDLKFMVTYSRTVSLGNGNFEKYTLSSEFMRGEATPSEAFESIRNQVISSIHAPEVIKPMPTPGSTLVLPRRETIEKIPWREGKYGEYCFEDQAPKELVDLLTSQGPQVIGDYRYKISKGKDRLFVNRHKITKKS